MKRTLPRPKSEPRKQRAKELRKAGNLAEALLWNKLKNKQMLGLDFDRQMPLGGYYVDFFCDKAKLIIEIDGDSHSNKIEYDQARDNYMKASGLKILRISDKSVLYHIDDVLEDITLACYAHSPSLRRGGKAKP